MENTNNVPRLRFPRFTDAWEQRELSSIASMHARIGWQNLRTSEFLDSGDYMLITGTDFENGAVNYSTCHYVAKERYEQDKNIQIENGSILITKDGTLGKVAYVQGLSMPATLNAGVFNVKIRNKTEVDEKYLFQYLKAPFLMSYVSQKATGGTIKHLNQNILVDFPVALPQIQEQQAIGEYFSNLDNLITLHQRKCDKLEEYKKAMLQKIFSQELRFKREDGTEYPEWKDCILSDYCEEIKASIDPKKYPNDSFLEYSMPAFDMGKIPNNVIGRDMNSNRKVVNYPCVLINKLNVRKKRIWKVLKPMSNSVCSAEFIPVKSDKMSIDFLECLALSDRFTARLLDCSTGTSNSQKRVTPNIIMDMSVSIPCLEEQQKIADFLSAFDEAISYAKQELDKWKELKKGLLQQMFV